MGLFLRKYWLAAGLVAVFCVCSCAPPVIETKDVLLSSREFFATDLTTEPTMRYRVNANFVTQGEHCIVYVAPAQKERVISAAEMNSLVYEFDRKIYPRITAAFGEPLYISGDDKRIILLFLDVVDGYSGSGSYVAGYFYPNDLMRSSASNMATMLYIDTYPGCSVVVSNSYATIAHELQHLINYSVRQANAKESMETWIDEGLSTNAEYLYKEEQQRGRTQYFSSGENTIRNGNYFYIWGNRGDLLAEYASTYMFFQWFGIQATGSYNVYKEIIHEEKSDYRAVTAVAQRRLQAVTPPGLTSEDAWRRLFGTWLAANAINEPYEYYGYKNKIDFVKVHSPLRSEVSLAPGEAVFSAAGETMPENAGTLNHVAISLKKQTAYFDVTQEKYDELQKEDGLDVIATYNYDTRAAGAPIPFTITGFLNEPDNSRSDSSTGADAAPRPVCGTIRFLENHTH